MQAHTNELAQFIQGSTVPVPGGTPQVMTFHGMSLDGIVTEAVVDGAVWYTVFIEPEVMMWLKTLNSTQWTYIPGGHWRLHVDVHEQLYTALVLRWS